MKIAGAIIQSKHILANTETTFEATYKKHNIYISTDHGFGSAAYPHLNRYAISVRGEDGGYAVYSFEDLHNMRDAIRYALKESLLINK